MWMAVVFMSYPSLKTCKTIISRTVCAKNCCGKRSAGIVYVPPKGVPNIPTASSIKIRSSIARIAAHNAIRYLILLTFLHTSSQVRPVPSSKTPITTKSVRVQFTSEVNCIAMNGMSKISATVSTIPLSLLFFIIIHVLFLSLF